MTATLTAPGPRQFLMLLALAVFWGTSFQFIKVAVETMPPLTLAAARIALGAAFLFAVLRLRGARLVVPGARRGRMAVVALVGTAGPLFLIAWGGARIDSAVSAIQLAITPLLVMMLAHISLPDEKMTASRALGVAFGFVGMALLIGPDAFAGFGAHVWGQLAVMLAALGFAVSSVVARGLSAGDALANATVVLIVSAAATVPVALAIDRPWTLSPSGLSLAAVIWLGILPTAVATHIYLHLIATTGANFVTSLNYLSPPLGVLAGVLVLDDRLEPRMLIAMAVIMGGIAIAELGRLRRR
ncbi:MAG: EamA/RhaT family transporter [Alphaproteobacteria bacterium]|nr:EamA/RhaT family transporter [Alphaproteobacteria bacterium]